MVHGIFSARLFDHLPDPGAALQEWARTTARRRHFGALPPLRPRGTRRPTRPPASPDDPLARPNLEPALRTAGWQLTEYDDAEAHFLALAVLAR